MVLLEVFKLMFLVSKPKNSSNTTPNKVISNILAMRNNPIPILLARNRVAACHKINKKIHKIGFLKKVRKSGSFSRKNPVILFQNKSNPQVIHRITRISDK